MSDYFRLFLLCSTVGQGPNGEPELILLYTLSWVLSTIIYPRSGELFWGGGLTKSDKDVIIDHGI